MKITALFDNQKEATGAVDVLTKADVTAEEIQVIESLDQKSAVSQPAPMPATHAGDPQPVPAYLSPLDIEERLGLPDEAADFFLRGVEKGGVLVMVETEKEDADKIKGLLHQNGGRTAA